MRVYYTFLWPSPYKLRSYHSHTQQILKRREVAAHNTKVMCIIYRYKTDCSISMTCITSVWCMPHFHNTKSARCYEVAWVRCEWDRLDCTFMLLECPERQSHSMVNDIEQTIKVRESHTTHLVIVAYLCNTRHNIVSNNSLPMCMNKALHCVLQQCYLELDKSCITRFIYIYIIFGIIIINTSSVCILTRLWAGQLGFNSLQRQGICLSTTASRPALRPTQPPIQCVLGTLSPGVKQPGCEVDHSPPPSVEVKNAWSYTSIPPICLTGAVLN
jgi:hypothetical protein